jgi:hypothetical protein
MRKFSGGAAFSASIPWFRNPARRGRGFTRSAPVQGAPPPSPSNAPAGPPPAGAREAAGAVAPAGPGQADSLAR